MIDSTIPVILGGERIDLRIASPGRALRLVQALATNDPEAQEAALAALLTYAWPTPGEVSGFADLWPRFPLADLHAAVHHVAEVVASWYPSDEEVAARVAAFPGR